MKREIIRIDEKKCSGCGECAEACPEGAIQMIDGKARLVNEEFCDGLGACIGDCPEDAISIETREAESYNEKAVVDRMLEQGEKVLKSHLKHLEEHGQENLLLEAINYLEEKKENIEIEDLLPKSTENPPSCECISSIPGEWADQKEKPSDEEEIPSALRQWPVQLELIPAEASYFDDEDVLISADCVPFAYGGFHGLPHAFLCGLEVCTPLRALLWAEPLHRVYSRYRPQLLRYTERFHTPLRNVY